MVHLPTHTFIADVALNLVEVRVLLFHQSRVTPSSDVGQRRIDLLYVVVHRNNRLGRPNEVAIPCPIGKISRESQMPPTTRD